MFQCFRAVKIAHSTTPPIWGCRCFNAFAQIKSHIQRHPRFGGVVVSMLSGRYTRAFNDTPDLGVSLFQCFRAAKNAHSTTPPIWGRRCFNAFAQIKSYIQRPPRFGGVAGSMGSRKYTRTCNDPPIGGCRCFNAFAQIKPHIQRHPRFGGVAVSMLSRS